jgi:hypothetical protein
MEGVDGNIAWPILIVLVLIARLVMDFMKTRAATSRRPSLDTDLGGLSIKVTALEKDLRETKQRMTDHENKLSRQVGALHTRINDVFGELKEITGMLKTHMERER